MANIRLNLQHGQFYFPVPILPAQIRFKLRLGLAKEFSILFWKNSTEYARNGFRYSAKEKCSYRGIPRFTEESIPMLETEWNYRKKMCFATKSCSRKQNWERVFAREMLRNGIPRVCFCFCSMEQNSELFLFSHTRNCCIFLLWLVVK